MEAIKHCSMLYSMLQNNQACRCATVQLDFDDDDKFTPTKHITPPPHHSSRPAVAHTGTETPLQ